MTDRVALITGATNGVGRVVAERIAQAGWLVLAHGRDRERGEALVGAIRAGGGKARFYPADFASLRDVAGLARSICVDHDALHLLINNAGIGYGIRGGGRETSADGHELRLAVNYLAPCLLTHLLIGRLVAGAPSRIVNVASNAQCRIDFDDLEMTQEYSGRDAYRRSKLALIMFSLDLAEALRGRGVSVNALHPATSMDTFMVREAGGNPVSSVGDGADAIMALALSQEHAGTTGLYFDGMRAAPAHEQAYDEAARAELRRRSLAMTALFGAN